MEADQLLTVKLLDGNEEYFALGLGEMPEQVDPHEDKTAGYRVRLVRYTVEPSGVLLVGWGLRFRDPWELGQ